jgi:hypothetical protein
VHPVVAVGHQQPRVDQDVEQLSAVGIDPEQLQRHAA